MGGRPAPAEHHHHLKELARAGLVHKVGERRKGNFIEALYQAVAPTIVVSPRAAWGDSRRLEALRGQMSLENLVVVGERLGRDAAALLDRATFDGEEIASAAVEAEVRFDSEEARAAFMKKYLKAVGPLFREYGRETRRALSGGARCLSRSGSRRSRTVTKNVERTFTVVVPVARAWEAFADSHERSQWEAVEYEIDPRPGGLLRWTLPGIEATGRVEEVQVHHLLRHIELTGPHAGWK